MIRSIHAASCGLATIITLAGCSLDRSAPHPFVVRATAESARTNPLPGGALTVPTAVIMREGVPVAATARMAKPWPAAVFVPSTEPEKNPPAMIMVGSYDAVREPVQTPMTPAMVPVAFVDSPVIASTTSIATAPETDAPEYIDISEAPSVPAVYAEPALPVIDATPPPYDAPVATSEATPRFPVQVPYGASF